MQLKNFVKTYDDCDCNGPFYVLEPRKFSTQCKNPKTMLLRNSKGDINPDQFSLKVSGQKTESHSVEAVVKLK